MLMRGARGTTRTKYLPGELENVGAQSYATALYKFHIDFSAHSEVPYTCHFPNYRLRVGAIDGL